jgi:predicted dehydrogenase
MRELYKATPWRRNDKSWNSWVAGGVHVVDLIRYIGGDVEEIMMYANKGEEDPDCGPIDDNHLSIMKLKNDATCKVWEVRCIKRAPEFTINLSVYGSRGSAQATLTNNEVGYFSLDDGEKQERFASLFAEKTEGIPIRAELQDFVSCILRGHEPRCDVRDGAQTVAAVLTGVEAQNKGLPQKVPAL